VKNQRLKSTKVRASEEQSGKIREKNQGKSGKIREN
jgi:hypothetical protein